MTTITAVTRYVAPTDLDSINSVPGDVARLTILISTPDTGVYVGPQSMGTGSTFPATVIAGASIGGYPLTPNQEYTFNISVIAGAGADDAELAVTTTNVNGAVVSYVVLENI